MSQQQMKGLLVINLPQFQQLKVLVIGDVMLDKYWSGQTKRISPEAPVPVVQVAEQVGKPGGAANVAMNLQAMGADVHLAGVVGDDEEGAQLKALLAAEGLSHSLVSSAQPTITKLRIIAQHQQLMRLDFEQPIELSDDTLMKAFAQSLSGVDVVVFSDYGKGTLADIQRFIQLCRGSGIPCLVDPKGNDFSKYQGATLLTPNLSEFEAIAGKCSTEEELIEQARSLQTQLSLESLLVTRGEAGMLWVDDHGHTSMGTKAQEVFDVTGAGDTVIAIMALGVGLHAKPNQMMHWASVAAALSISHLGAFQVSHEALQAALLLEQPHVKTGVLDKATLQQLVSAAKANGERIVFTNGCFDLLHVGHVKYLEQAKALGDRLIVAINTDESVRALKGPTRPINSLEARMRVLGALACVDWVVPFAEPTPIPLLQTIQPHVLAKGGDYQLSDVVGAEEVLAYGGDVEVLHHEKGQSTTKITEKIKSPSTTEA